MEGRKQQITKLVNDNGEEIIQTEKIRKTIEEYYKTLYETNKLPPPGKEETKRIIVKNMGSEK